MDIIEQLRKLKVNHIFVDLDGTLIETDLGFYSMRKFITPRIWRMALVLYWTFLGGRARAKHELAKRVEITSREIPWIESNVDYVRNLHRNGFKLILATGSDEHYAQMITQHLDFFETFLASNATTNMIGPNKLRAMQKHLKNGPLVYVGNSRVDLKVWSGCSAAIVANASETLVEKAKSVTTVLAVI